MGWKGTTIPLSSASLANQASTTFRQHPLVDKSYNCHDPCVALDHPSNQTVTALSVILTKTLSELMSPGCLLDSAIRRQLLVTRQAVFSIPRYQTGTSRWLLNTCSGELNNGGALLHEFDFKVLIPSSAFTIMPLPSSQSYTEARRDICIALSTGPGQGEALRASGCLDWAPV